MCSSRLNSLYVYLMIKSVLIRTSSSYQTIMQCRKGDEFRCTRLFNRKSQVGKPWVAIQLSSPQQLTIYTIYQHVSVKIMETHTDNSLICNLITSSVDFLIFTDTRCLSKCSMISCTGVFVNSLMNSIMSCGTTDINRSSIDTNSSTVAFK